MVTSSPSAVLERAAGVVRNPSSAYAAASLVRAATGTLILPYLVATLPSHEYGLIVLMLPVWWIAQPLLSWGASEGLVRAVADQDARSVAGALCWVLVLVTAMTALSAAALSFTSRAVLGAAWSEALLLGVVVAGLQSLMSCELGLLRGSGRIRAATAVLLAFGLLPPALGGAAVLVLKPTAETYFAGYAVGMVATTVLGLSLLLARGIALGRSWGVTVLACRLGLPVSPQTVALQGVDAVTRRMVLAAAGPAALGTFGVAAAVGNLVWNVVKALGQGWAPQIYRGDPGEARDKAAAWLASGTLASWVLLPLLGCVMLLVEQVLPASYDPTGFTSAAILLAGAIAPGISFVATSTLCFQQQRTGVMAWSSPVVAGVVVVATIVGARLLPWEFLAASSAVALLLTSAAMAASLNRELALPLRDTVLLPASSLALAVTLSTTRFAAGERAFLVLVAVLLVALPVLFLVRRSSRAR